MALSQSFEASENQAGTIIKVLDETGVYDANNTGGYGSPNTERTDLALIISGDYKASTGDVSLTAQSYDPETVTEFEFQDIDGDGNGWYQFKIYSIARKTGSETPSTGDYVYDFTADELQRWNGSAWVTILQANWISSLESDNETAYTLNYAHLSGYYKTFNYLIKLLITGCNCAERNELRSYQSEVREQLEGFRITFCEGNRSVAQLRAEKYSERISELLALE